MFANSVDKSSSVFQKEEGLYQLLIHAAMFAKVLKSKVEISLAINNAALFVCCLLVIYIYIYIFFQNFS